MDIVSIGTDAVKEFYHAPAWLLLVAAVIAVGYALKAFPAFPNRLIPIVCMALGAVLLPLLADPKSLNPDQRHPALVFALMGLVIGMAAWACHGIILKRLEKKLGLFQADDQSAPQPPPKP